MAIRKIKVPKHHKSAAKVVPPKDTVTSQPSEPTVNQLPMQAERLLHDHKNVELFEDVLNQINAFYDAAASAGREVLPIFVGLTAGGLMIEMSAVRDRSLAGQPVAGDQLNVFTYQLGTDAPQDIQPREIAEANMMKGQEQIRLQSDDFPKPDQRDGKALAHWRFVEAETIQLQTMGVYEIQPENYSEISYGHGIQALGGSEESVIPIQHFGSELV